MDKLNLLIQCARAFEFTNEPAHVAAKSFASAIKAFASDASSNELITLAEMLMACASINVAMNMKEW